MSVLVTTLRTLLAQADAHFEAGRLANARGAYELLLERSQDRSDRPMEVISRAQLASVQIRRRELAAAADELAVASRLLDPGHLEAYGRYRRVLARLAVAEGEQQNMLRELRDYLLWAEDVGLWPEAVDACSLLAWHGPTDERLEWLERGIETAIHGEVHSALGALCTHLATGLDEQGSLEDALEAYQQAYTWFQREGGDRQRVGAAWAVGAAACRAEDWPLARQRLEEAVEASEHAPGCSDLLPLALADLAQVNEASGDVIEARRLLIRALEVGAGHDLSALWPDRWRAMLDYAKRLDL